MDTPTSNHTPGRRTVILVITLLLLLSSCSTPTKTALLTGSIGMVVGGALGAAVSQNESHEQQNQALVIGSVVGASAGGLIGYYGHKPAPEPQPIQIGNKGERVPKVLVPGATCETVKQKIEGKIWEQEHLRCSLKDTVWSLE